MKMYELYFIYSFFLFKMYFSIHPFCPKSLNTNLLERVNNLYSIHPLCQDFALENKKKAPIRYEMYPRMDI